MMFEVNCLFYNVLFRALNMEQERKDREKEKEKQTSLASSSLSQISLWNSGTEGNESNRLEGRKMFANVSFETVEINQLEGRKMFASTDAVFRLKPLKANHIKSKITFFCMTMIHNLYYYHYQFCNLKEKIW